MASRPTRRTSPGVPPREDGERLRGLVQTFVRSFGLLVSNKTPCGHPISVSHAHALMTLLEHQRTNERVSQADLGKVLAIDKSNVTRLCMRMEEAGHVVQSRAPDDGRSRLVELTEKGVKLASGIERSSRARFSRILEEIAPSQRRALFDALSNLNAAVAALGEAEDQP